MFQDSLNLNFKSRIIFEYFYFANIFFKDFLRTLVSKALTKNLRLFKKTLRSKDFRKGFSVKYLIIFRNIFTRSSRAKFFNLKVLISFEIFLKDILAKNRVFYKNLWSEIFIYIFLQIFEKKIFFDDILAKTRGVFKKYFKRTFWKNSHFLKNKKDFLAKYREFKKKYF